MSGVTLAERKLSIHALSQSLFLPQELPQISISDLQESFPERWYSPDPVHDGIVLGFHHKDQLCQHRTYQEHEIRVLQVSAELELVQVRSRLQNEV